MYFDDHDPAHFHAIYGEAEALIGVVPIQVLHSDLPGRALSMVLEWTALHQSELMTNWQRLYTAQSAQKIAPLA